MDVAQGAWLLYFSIAVVGIVLAVKRRYARLNKKKQSLEQDKDEQACD